MSVVVIIIFITVLVSIAALNNYNLKAKFIFNPYIIYHRRDYKRFITSAFIHGDYLHLFFNMLVLWIFGSQVERTYEFHFGINGKWYFLGFYLMAILFSSLSTYFRFKNIPSYNSLGASGGVSAVLFSYIILLPSQSICLYGLLCLPGVVWGVLYLIYTYYMSKNQLDNINHEAHLFGALFGIILIIFMIPKSLTNFFYQILDLTFF